MEEGGGCAASTSQHNDTTATPNSNLINLEPATNATTTNNTTPKLRLTFKLSDIRAASPVTGGGTAGTAAITTLPPTTPVPGRIGKKRGPKTPRKPKGGDPGTFAVPYKRRNKKEVVVIPTSNVPPPPTESTAQNSMPVPITEKERASSKVQFPEQILFVQEMRRFKCRRWRVEPATVTLLGGGRTLTIPCWVKDKVINCKVAGRATSLPTFVCTYEGCHKIFDAKDKWRRHQNLHRKKAAAAGLQLKLNMGIIKAAANNNGNPNTDMMNTTMTSLPPSETDPS